MDLSTLNTVLDQAPDITNRMNHYVDRLQNDMHPRFEQLVHDYNSALLESLRTQMNAAYTNRSEDYEPIGEIIDQLSEAAESLQAAGATMAQLEAALNRVNSRYDEAAPYYDQSLELEEFRKQIIDMRQAAEDENPTPEMHNYFLKFDVELKRDGAIIEFLRDTARLYIDRLKAVRTKISLLKNAAGNTAPPSNVGPIVTLLEQVQAISNRASVVIPAMESAKTKLFNIGNLLLSRNGDFPNSELSSVKTSLNNLIAAAPGESVSHDDLIRQLNDARTGFRPESGNPALSTARTLAGARRQEAVSYHEKAHLLKVSFGKLDVIMRRLDSLDATSAEKDFYTNFRGAVDAFNLLTTYTELSYGKFALTSQQWWDIINLFMNDQRNKVQLRNDNLPFALLPVRLETRFMTTKYVKDNVAYSSFSAVYRTQSDVLRIKNVSRENALQGTSDPMLGFKLTGVAPAQKIADKQELWVRIYPDNIAIH